MSAMPRNLCLVDGDSPPSSPWPAFDHVLGGAAQRLAKVVEQIPLDCLDAASMDTTDGSTASGPAACSTQEYIACVLISAPESSYRLALSPSTTALSPWPSPIRGPCRTCRVVDVLSILWRRTALELLRRIAPPALPHTRADVALPSFGESVPPLAVHPAGRLLSAAGSPTPKARR